MLSIVATISVSLSLASVVRLLLTRQRSVLSVWITSLFGISNDVAMQMVGVGFIIGVVQDSVETALNSAGDVEFAATAEYHQWLKQSKPLPEFLSGKKN